MSWMRRVWGGPFKTPPLQQPITVGWVLLKLFETLWRILLILCLMVALAGLALWLSEQNPLSSRIRVQLSGHSSSCVAKGYPLYVTVVNDSSKMIGEVDVRIKVYPQGKSEDVASFVNARHELHDILGPDEENGYCFPMPDLEPGSTGPYTVAAEVTYASELSKDVPVAAEPAPTIQTISPPPLVRMEAPPAPAKHRRTGPKTIWQSVTDLFGLAILLALVASGGYALIGLYDRAFKTGLQARLFDDNKGGESGCFAIGLVGFLNMLIVGGGGTYLLSALGWDAWLTQFDDWSWAHGLADGGSLLLAAVACQWPWAILLTLRSTAGESVKS